MPLNKIIKFCNTTIVIRSVFPEDGKYYPQVSLDECLHELQMLKYDRIDIWEGIDHNKTNASKECDICHYWYLKDTRFKYEFSSIEPYLCDGCHVLMQKAINFNDVTTISVKGSDYRTHLWYLNKDDAKNIMKNYNLNKKNGS